MYNVEKRIKELNKKKNDILAKKQEITERFDGLIAEVEGEIEKLNQSEQELGKLTKRQVEIMDSVKSIAEVSAKEKQEGISEDSTPENEAIAIKADGEYPEIDAASKPSENLAPEILDATDVPEDFDDVLPDEVPAENAFETQAQEEPASEEPKQSERSGGKPEDSLKETDIVEI